VRTGWLALRRIGVALGMGLLTAVGAQAQTASQYRLVATSSAFTPIVGGTTVAINADDVVSGDLPIGFSFTFAGVNYTTFRVNSNGYLGFGSTLSNNLSSNISDGTAGGPVACALVSDLDGRTAGATPTYLLTGTAPNRVLTMQWLNWGNYNGVSNVVSFQTKLFEGSNRIQFAYRQEATPPNRTFGIGLYSAPGDFLSLNDSGSNPTTSSTVATTLPLPATGQVYTFVPGNVWTGAVSTAWNVAGNWADGVVPTASTNAIIAAVPNQPIVTGAQACSYLSVSPGATLTLATNAILTTANTTNLASTSALVQQAGSELRIGQDLSNAGATFTLDPTSLVSFRAAAPTTHALIGTGTVSFQNLSLGQQAAGDQLSIQGTATVQRLMTLAQAATATVATGGSLTLLSNAAGTGQIAKDANSTVDGTVTVQRYITPSLNAGAGYRHYAAPITNATVASLTTAGFTPTLNTTYNTSPTPNLVTPFPTVFAYDQARVGTITSTYGPFDQGFLSPAPGDAMESGRGYTVNIPASQTVAFTGTLANGTVTKSGLTRINAQAGWHLLGNPYASVIDAHVVQANSTGMDAATYVYQSTGQYTGQYVAYVNGVGSGHNIASGQGFFKRVTTVGSTGSVSFTNAARLSTYADPAFQRAAADTRTLVHLDLVSAATQQRDAAYVYFQAGATAGFDASFDAYKLPSGSGTYLALTTAAEPLAVNGLALMGNADVTIPLTVAVATTGTYTLEAAQLLNLPVGKFAYLRDAQTGAVVDLAQQPSYRFAMNAAFTGPRFSLVISSRSLLATAPASLTAQVAVYPNPARSQVTVELPTSLRQQAVGMKLVNALGQTVKSALLPASAAAHTLPLTGVAAGVYSLSLSTTQGIITKRIVIE